MHRRFRISPSLATLFKTYDRLNRLDREGVASGAPDGALGLGASHESVLVGDAGERALGGLVDAAAEVDIVDGGSALGLGVDRGDGSLGVLKGAGLDQDVGTHASVDTSGADGEEVVVVDVDGAEADRGVARVDIEPVVVGVGDVELAGVLGGVAVGVADERGLVLENS